MKFSLVPKALALAATVTLASCGAGGKATFPVNVTVSNVVYPGLVLSTNGQDHTVDVPTKAADGTIPDVTFTFANQIDYGTVYNVVPKGYGSTLLPLGQQPAHQTCTGTLFPITGTAGLLAVIDIRYTCAINAYALTGTVKGLTGTGLVLANGSLGGTIPVSPALDATTSNPTGADVAFTMASVQFAQTYGVTVLTQPTGQTCTLTGGANGTGAGTIDESVETAGSVSNFVVTCVNN